MPFVLAALLLAVFTANVAFGAITGTPVVTVVWEWLILFAASISFTVAILGREAAAKKKAANDQ